MSEFIFSNSPNTVLGYKKNGDPIYPIAGGSSPYGDQDGGVDSGGSGGQQGNPAWSELLQELPQELHEKVTPHLQKWDSNFTEQVQKVHSEYEPFKKFKDQGFDPDRLDFGARIVSALESDPKMVYEALQTYYNFNEEPGANSGQGQGEEPPSGTDPYAQYDSRFKDIERKNDLMAQALFQQQRDRELADEEQALETEFSEAKEKFKERGNLTQDDEQLIVGMLMADENLSVEQAMGQYYDRLDAYAKSIKEQLPKPMVLGSGGGLPGTSKKPNELSNSETKNLVADILKAHAESNRG